MIEWFTVIWGSSWWRHLYRHLRTSFTIFLTTVIPPVVQQELSEQRNWRALFIRFLTLAGKPRLCAPVIIDLWLLLQFTWDRRELGPDVVYPLLSIKKRQSGRLARLILEHSRDECSYELRSTTTSPQGVSLPRVAVIDLDDDPHHSYSTHCDLHGLACLLVFFEISFTIIIHALYLRDQGSGVVLAAWCYSSFVSLIYCTAAVVAGEGTLMLARRSDTSTPGCAVLLDQDFTVVLNGPQSVVEAIVESGFSRSDCNSIPGFHRPGVDRRVSTYDIIETLSDAGSLAVSTLFFLLFCPPRLSGFAMTLLLVVLPLRLQMHTASYTALLYNCSVFVWILLPFHIVLLYVITTIQSEPQLPLWLVTLQVPAGFLSFSLLILLDAKSRDQNYPIQTTKLLDALGHPGVRKWEFDTLAAAATFQCLVLCRDISCPIRRIDIPAFLDTVVPDQRDIWKAWKNRVADRIVHETDIDFAPMIPMFGDERQKQLKDLLDQAQFGYDTYRHFFD
ncbi:hypothetical protein V8E55_010560 [Tylopilus felleus]